MTPTNERGTATALMLVVVLLITALASVAIALGQAHVARARAQTAADLAAIGAAYEAEHQRVGHSRARREEPCTLADRIAQENRASLHDCTVHPGGDVTIEVLVQHPLNLGTARASARAGPR